MTYLPNKEIKQTENILRALNHPLREKILSNIWKTNNIKNVTAMYEELGIEQSVTSQHLAILRNAKIVTRQRYGKHIYYSVDKKEIDRVASLIKQINNNKN